MEVERFPQCGIESDHLGNLILRVRIRISSLVVHRSHFLFVRVELLPHVQEDDISVVTISSASAAASAKEIRISGAAADDSRKRQMG